jgi:hypothetical protein
MIPLGELEQGHAILQRPEGVHFPQVCFDPRESLEQERVERDGEQRILLLEYSHCDRSRTQNEGEFPDLTAPGSTRPLRKERSLQERQHKFAHDEHRRLM